MLAALRAWTISANRETGAAAARALVELVERRGAEFDVAALDLIADALARVLRDVADDMRPSFAERMRCARDASRGSPDRAPPEPSQSASMGAPTFSSDGCDALAAVRVADPGDLLALAAGPSLDPAVTHVMVARGDEDVWRRLVENDAARLSAPSLMALAELALTRLALKHALARRADLPAAVADRLAPYLSETDRAAMRDGLRMRA